MEAYYEIRLILDDQLVQQVVVPGSNALEAFETAADNGLINVPGGTVFNVFAINQATGLTVKFEAGRAV